MENGHEKKGGMPLGGMSGPAPVVAEGKTACNVEEGAVFDAKIEVIEGPVPLSKYGVSQPLTTKLVFTY